MECPRMKMKNAFMTIANIPEYYVKTITSKQLKTCHVAPYFKYKYCTSKVK